MKLAKTKQESSNWLALQLEELQRTGEPAQRKEGIGHATEEGTVEKGTEGTELFYDSSEKVHL